MNPFCLHLGLPVLVVGVLAWTFQFDLNFHSKISAHLTAKRKTHGPTKADNKIIKHHGNWVISRILFCESSLKNRPSSHISFYEPSLWKAALHPKLGFLNSLRKKLCSVGWGCRIHWLHLCRGVRPPNKCPGYDTKQSDGEVPVMLGPGGIRSTSSLPLLPGLLWPGVVAPDRVLSMG